MCIIFVVSVIKQKKINSLSGWKKTFKNLQYFFYSMLGHLLFYCTSLFVLLSDGMTEIFWPIT